MDHSTLSADFDSAMLNCWDVNDDGNPRLHPTESSSEGIGSSLTSSAQSPGHTQSVAQSRKEGFTRLPSFPTSLGGALSTSDRTGQNPHIPSEASAPVAASASNLATAAWQVPMHTGTFNQSTVGPTKMTRTMGSPHYNTMVQYALSGQAAGAPFPSVSFNRKSQDTVSNLSVDTSSKSAVATHNSTTSTPRGHLSTDQGALTTTQLHPFGIQSSTATTNSSQFNPYMFNTHAMFACNPELLAVYQVSQLQMAAQLAAQAPARPAVAPTVLPPVPAPPPERIPRMAQAAKKPAKAPKSKKASKTSSDAAPPFLLFDAPCELRANFMQTQRMLNLPLHHDNNSYHYGMTVNGFHPQSNAPMDPSRLSLAPNADVKLIDSRHTHHDKKGRGEGKERNEREQKRAQKITDLIEQIRLSIEDGGWKVEMKSKSHTLTKCADYVKHLMKRTKEKEEAVEKARVDLEVKERKLEENKALLQGGRSENESVTSSLTASSSVSMQESGTQRSSRRNAPCATKRKAAELAPDSCKDAKSKKAKLAESTKDSLGGDYEGSGGPKGHSIFLDKMSSSISDITDSNRGSSDSGGEKASGVSHEKRHRQNDDESSEIASTSSISSTAAVISGTGSENREHGHADVVKKKKKSHSRPRKRSRQERSSLNPKFGLDYEEVFFSSNIPQLIATPAGRIVAWNKFFLRATGLGKNDIQRLTIFSIVQPDKLANLFEMAAEALRRNSSSASGSATSPSSSGHTSGESTLSSSNADDASRRAIEYATMTLPCATFSAGSARNSAGVTKHCAPLYMTVALMPDEDVRKRCFHCVLTDCCGTDGQLGFITPELLAKYFVDPEHTKLEPLSRASPVQIPN